MAIQRTHQIDIPQLDDEEAVKLLRQVLYAAGLRTGTELPPTAETRHALSEGLQQLDQSMQPVAHSAPDQPGDVARQALLVLAQDPAFDALLVDQRALRAEGKTSSDFAVDPISFVGVTTLALVVLNTYIDVKRDVRGRWSIHIKLSPVSDKLKTELLALAKKLLALLPPT